MAPTPPKDPTPDATASETPHSPEQPNYSRPTSSSPSNASDSENPFVQFRRFADSQISSVLQSVIGLPSLFVQPPPNTRWIVIDEEAAMRRRQQQHQQELEEDWQQNQEAAARAEAEKENSRMAAAQVEMQKWGAAPATDQVDSASPSSPANEGDGEEEKSRRWYSSLGWDGQQKSSQTKSDRPGPGTSGRSGVGGIRYSASDTDKLDPFKDPNDAIPWLLTNEYSPLYLAGCMKSHIDGFKVVPTAPIWNVNGVSTLVPQFSSSCPRNDKQRGQWAQLQWCDAFEDLISLQNNGRMAARSHPSRQNMDWLSQIVSRGSLGRGWDSFSSSNSLLFVNGDRKEVFLGFKGPRLWGLEQFAAEGCARPPSGHSKVSDALRKAFSEADTDKLKQTVEDMENNFESKHGHPLPSALSSPPTTSAPISVKSEINADQPSEFDFDSVKLTPAPALDLKELVKEIDREFGRFLDNDDSLQNVINGAIEMLGLPGLQGLGHDFLSRWPHAEAVVDAIRASAVSQLEEAERMQDEDDESKSDNTGKIVLGKDSVESSSFDQWSDSSSTSSSSWSRSPTEHDTPDSVISMLTKTEQRTLPDGTVETKKVLKKKFADGTEESNESIERQAGTRKTSNKYNPDISPGRDNVMIRAKKEYRDQATSTNETKGKEETGGEKQRGWFWN